MCVYAKSPTSVSCPVSQPLSRSVRESACLKAPQSRGPDSVSSSCTHSIWSFLDSGWSSALHQGTLQTWGAQQKEERGPFLLWHPSFSQWSRSNRQISEVAKEYGKQETKYPCSNKHTQGNVSHDFLFIKGERWGDRAPIEHNQGIWAETAS